MTGRDSLASPSFRALYAKLFLTGQKRKLVKLVYSVDHFWGVITSALQGFIFQTFASETEMMMIVFCFVFVFCFFCKTDCKKTS